MRTECLPVQTIPHLTALYRDFVSDHSRVAPFYAASPLNPNYRELASKVVYPSERRGAVTDILERQNRGWGASEKTMANIQRLRKGATAVVTGQQVVLFGGPMFTILKALTAIKHAEAATKTGVDCVPIFWLASEDHDLPEVSSATFLSDAGPRELRYSSPSHNGEPVGQIVFDESMQRLCDEAVATIADPEVAALVRECYKPGETFAGAFARLFTRILAELGLILIDPADPELHAVATPLLRKAVEESAALTDGLMSRTKELEAAGYHAQVKVTNSSTVLFALQQGVRTVVHRANGHFTIGKDKFEETQLFSQIESRPQDFSGNALFRPVIQDYLLPTIAYVGGPGEIAYFAQSQVVFKRLLGRVTAVLPRMSATVVDARAERLLKKYELSVADAFVPAEALRKAIATKALPRALSDEFGRSQEVVREQLAALSQQLHALDPTIEDAAKRSVAKMEYQLERLRGRAARAQERKNTDLVRQAKALSESLFPLGDLQERHVSGISLLGRYGAGLLSQLYGSLDLGCPGHQLLYL